MDHFIKLEVSKLEYIRKLFFHLEEESEVIQESIFNKDFNKLIDAMEEIDTQVLYQWTFDIDKKQANSFLNDDFYEVGDIIANILEDHDLEDHINDEVYYAIVRWAEYELSQAAQKYIEYN